MSRIRIHRAWRDACASQCFRTAVSLHGHTLHSRESLDCLYGFAQALPLLAYLMRRLQRLCRQTHRCDLDFSRAWWTPPLSPRSAWEVEAAQIEGRLGLRAVVSLTDHDTIEAPIGLRVLDRMHEIPISVEWTAPYFDTAVHLGVHGLPPRSAREMAAAMREYTHQPRPPQLAGILAWLDAFPEVLIVVNHPFLDERRIGQSRHTLLITKFFVEYRPWIHALELNGLQPWSRNRLAAQAARAIGLPLVSGGDRHGREPSAAINLTNTSGFPEFVAEVRQDGRSDVLFMPHYQEPFRLRVIHNLYDMVRDDPEHSLGWRRWSDRVFHQLDDGSVRPFSQLWANGAPRAASLCVGLLRLIADRRVRPALRLAFGDTRRAAV
jgi:hypothetical protein